ASDHQRTNSSAAVERDQFRDSRSTLSTARNARHFLQEIANAGRGRRGRKPQIVCHARHLRGLSEEVDSAAMEIVSTSGHKTGPSQAVDQIHFLNTTTQYEDQEHYKR